MSAFNYPGMESDNKHATNAISIMNEAVEAVEDLKRQILNLMAERNQCIIHLAQYQNDYLKMHDIYSKFKQQISSYDNQPQPTYASIPMDDVPSAPSPKPTDRSQLSERPIKSPSIPEKAETSEPTTLLTTDIQWSVKSSTSANYNVSLRYVLNTGTVVTSVQYDPTGSLIAFADNRTLQVIHAANGNLVFSADIPHPPGFCDIHTRVIKFSQDGTLVATSTAGHQIAIFNVITHSLTTTLEGHEATVSSLLFLSDKKTLVSGAYDGSLIIWDLNSMTLISRIIHSAVSAEPQSASKDGSIISLAETAGGDFVAVGFMNRYVGIYEETFKQVMSSFKAHDEYLLSVVSGPKPGMICTTSHDKTAKLWTLQGAPTCKHTFSGHDDFVLCAAFSPDEAVPLLLTGSKDESIRAWDYRSGEHLFTIVAHQNTIFGIGHHPIHPSFVSCSGDGLVCVWDYRAP